MPQDLLQDFKTYILNHQGWLAVIRKMQHSNIAFSFQALPKLEGSEQMKRWRHSSAPGTSLLASSEQTLLDKSQPAFLQTGEAYATAVTQKPLNAALDLIKYSESQGHLLHNAAVCWLNTRPDASESEKFRERLCECLLLRIAEETPEPGQRKLALEQYLKDHMVLGVINRSRRTQFHTTRQIELHPAFWGLFLFSSRSSWDVGVYPADTADRAFLHSPYYPNGETAEDAQYWIYERIPRLFNASDCAPGVYLHRSYGHGRDDFLVHKPKTDNLPIMVLSTKGSGYNFDTLPGFMRQKYRDEADEWNTTSTLLPFATHGDDVYASFGFLTEGHQPGESISQTYQGFERLFEQALKLTGKAKSINNQLVKKLIDGLDKLMAEPYACIEIKQGTQGLRPGIGQSIALPSALIFGATHETSLRLCRTYQNRDEQDYIYGHHRLELAEWERSFAWLDIPAQTHARMDAAIVATCMSPTSGFALRDSQDQLIEHLTNELVKKAFGMAGGNGDVHPGLIDICSSFRRRALLAYKANTAMLASLVTFLSGGMTPGSDANNCFDGRNFSSGPRDSLEWGDTQSEDIPVMIRTFKGMFFVGSAELGGINLWKAIGQPQASSQYESDEEQRWLQVYGKVDDILRTKVIYESLGFSQWFTLPENQYETQKKTLQALKQQTQEPFLQEVIQCGLEQL